MSHNFEQLKAHILPLPRATVFEVARTERVLHYVEVSDEFDWCPCGQDIKEHCYIRNTVTGHQTYVGNLCGRLKTNGNQRSAGGENAGRSFCVRRWANAAYFTTLRISAIAAQEPATGST